MLEPFRESLGKAHVPYLNHAERVFRIAGLMDRQGSLSSDNLEIACAFHDLGIWTDGTWDYLRPSEDLCRNYLAENGMEDRAGEILLMIDRHHKLLPYRGKHEISVELFRKADLVDFSAGTVRFSVPRQFYRDLTSEYPMHGFHGHLFRSFWKHFKRRPWDPFPMVKV